MGVFSPRGTRIRRESKDYHDHGEIRVSKRRLLFLALSFMALMLLSVKPPTVEEETAEIEALRSKVSHSPPRRPKSPSHKSSKKGRSVRLNEGLEMDGVMVVDMRPGRGEQDLPGVDLDALESKLQARLQQIKAQNQGGAAALQQTSQLNTPLRFPNPNAASSLISEGDGEGVGAGGTAGGGDDNTLEQDQASVEASGLNGDSTGSGADKGEDIEDEIELSVGSADGGASEGESVDRGGGTVEGGGGKGGGKRRGKRAKVVVVDDMGGGMGRELGGPVHMMENIHKEEDLDREIGLDKDGDGEKEAQGEEAEDGEEDDEEDSEEGETEEVKAGYHECPKERGKHPTLEGLRVGFPKKMNRTDAFVNQKNYKKVLKGSMALQSQRSWRYLPKDGERVERAYKFRSCAVVGNSGALRWMHLGPTIDHHDVIMRLNQAPTTKYQKYTGVKTTFRMMNRLWTAHYGSGRFVEMSLPLERGVTIIVSRTDGHQFEKMHRTIKALRPDVAILYLSSRVVAAARKLLVAYRVRLCQMGYGPYSGGSTPSSGYVGIFLLMHMCQQLSLYGFGRAKANGNYLPYHYYEGVGSRKEGDPTHSFSSEEALLYQLAREKHLQLCTFRESNHTCGGDNACREENRVITKHNRVCGFNKYLPSVAQEMVLRMKDRDFDFG